MVEDEYLLDLFERAAGDAPSASDALAELRPRIRSARRRRAAVRGGASLVVLVLLGSVISSTTTHDSKDVRVGGSDTTAVVDSTSTTVRAPTSVARADGEVPAGASAASPASPTTVARPRPGGAGGGRGSAAPAPARPTEQQQVTKVVVASKGGAPGHAPSASTTSAQTSVVQSSSSVGGGTPQVTSFDAQGGTVEVKYTDSSMALGAVSPSPGWSIADAQATDDEIQVTFSQASGGDPVDVDVHMDDGKPVSDNADPSSSGVSTGADGSGS